MDLLTMPIVKWPLQREENTFDKNLVVQTKLNDDGNCIM